MELWKIHYQVLLLALPDGMQHVAGVAKLALARRAIGVDYGINRSTTKVRDSRHTVDSIS